MYSQSLITGSGVTLEEALATGGETTLIGLSIVFGVLIILMIVLLLFKVIFYKDPKKAVPKQTLVQQIQPEAEQTAPKASYETEDEEELIAVLTAAVAASLNTSVYKLNIRSYRRIDNNMPAWNRAGVSETINNRF